MNIHSIRSKSKSEQVSESIIEQIKSGAWTAFEKIPGENQLSTMFEVSRTSVRQAISQLVGQGILSVKHGEGTYVNEILPSDYFANIRQLFIMETPEYLEIQEFRKIIEPSIAYFAALNAKPKDIEAIELSVKNQTECARENNMKAYAKEDQHFHLLLAECTNNSIVVKTIGIVSEIMSLAMEHTTAISGYSDGLDYHTEIYEHIKNREPKKASFVMQKHIENNINTALEREEHSK